MQTVPLLLRPASTLVGDAAALDPEIRRARQATPVALVSMPFVSHLRPSIQLGLLKAITASHGFPVRTFHLNLDFAALIGPAIYEKLCDFGRVPVGDWLFSVAAFGGGAPDPDGLVFEHHGDDVAGILGKLRRTEQDLLDIRSVEVPRYLDWLMESVAWGNFSVVGFTSTFQQNIASFALARRIKERYPAIKTVFGGANFEDEMGLELVRSMPWVDYAVTGEGDRSFPELLMALAEGGDAAAVAGVATCDADGRVVQGGSRRLLEELDELPIPDYGEFFERGRVLRVFSPESWAELRIPFESARGCWWGQRKHCTFCGLNGAGMTFRSKSASRVRAELNELSRRHGLTAFSAVDNIMDASYFNRLLPELARDGARYDLYYEVKSNLHRDHIRLLRDAGVRGVQPGIESLSTHILQLMKKGVTGIQNVNTLRWCRFYGVEADWNVLYGFPGETEDDYRQQHAWLSLIRHLQPPASMGRIWLERFSPLYADRAMFPARFVAPEPWYRWVYPSTVDINKVAYFFDYELDDVPSGAAMGGTHELVEAWKQAWRSQPKPWLTFRSAGDHLWIEDGRQPDRVRVHEFEGPVAPLYRLLSDRPATLDRVKEGVAASAPPAAMEAALEHLCAQGLALREGPLYLSLALPAPADADENWV